MADEEFRTNIQAFRSSARFRDCDVIPAGSAPATTPTRVSASAAGRFPCDRVILASHSEYFARLLEDTNVKRITLPYDEDVIETLLRCIYSSDYTFIAPSLSARLLSAAHSMQLDTVKVHCERLLISSLRPDNCVEMSRLAIHTHSIPLLDAAVGVLIESLEILRSLCKNDVARILTGGGERELSYDLVIDWVLHDSGRKRELYGLLRLLDLSSLDVLFLTDVVGEQPLILSDPPSLALYTHTLRDVIGSALCAALPPPTLFWTVNSREWSYGPKMPGKHPGNLVIRDDVAYVSCSSDTIYTLHLTEPGEWRRMRVPQWKWMEDNWSVYNVQGRLYAAVGTDNEIVVQSYDDSTRLWSEVHVDSDVEWDAGPRDMRFHTSACVGERLYVMNIGGYLHEFDTKQPDAGWRLLGRARPQEHGDDGSYMELLEWNGRLAAVGAGFEHVRVFHPETRQWTNGPALPEAREQSCGVTGCGPLLVATGGGSVYSNGWKCNLDMYVDGSWQALPSLRKGPYHQLTCYKNVLLAVSSEGDTRALLITP